jgi:hypothetical protein
VYAKRSHQRLRPVKGIVRGQGRTRKRRCFLEREVLRDLDEGVHRDNNVLAKHTVDGSAETSSLDGRGDISVTAGRVQECFEKGLNAHTCGH